MLESSVYRSDTKPIPSSEFSWPDLLLSVTVDNTLHHAYHHLSVPGRKAVPRLLINWRLTWDNLLDCLFDIALLDWGVLSYLANVPRLVTELLSSMCWSPSLAGCCCQPCCHQSLSHYSWILGSWISCRTPLVSFGARTSGPICRMVCPCFRTCPEECELGFQKICTRPCLEIGI